MNSIAVYASPREVGAQQTNAIDGRQAAAQPDSRPLSFGKKKDDASPVGGHGWCGERLDGRLNVEASSKAPPIGGYKLLAVAARMGTEFGGRSSLRSAAGDPDDIEALGRRLERRRCGE